MPKKQSAVEQMEKSLLHDIKGIQKTQSAKKAWVEERLKLPEYLEAMYKLCINMDKAHGFDIAASSSSHVEVDLASTWVDQYNKPCVVPSKLLQAVLQKVDRIVFSAGNLKQTCIQGQREPPKEVLSHVIEYVADIPSSSLLAKPLRNLDTFTELVKSKVKKERLQDLLLAPEKDMFNLTSDYGIYIIKDERSTGKGIQVALRFKQAMWQTVQKDMEGPLELDENYSQVSACIREKHGSQYQMLHELFDLSTASVGPAEKVEKPSDGGWCKQSDGDALPKTPDELPAEEEKVELPVPEGLAFHEDPGLDLPPVTPVATKEKRLKRKNGNMLADLKGASSEVLATNAIVAAEEILASTQKVPRLHSFFKPLPKDASE
eukprot:6467184-Amphidinium_carterae.1